MASTTANKNTDCELWRPPVAYGVSCSVRDYAIKFFLFPSEDRCVAATAERVGDVTSRVCFESFHISWSSSSNVVSVCVRVFEKGCECSACGIQQRCSVRSSILKSFLPIDWWVEPHRVKDTASVLEPERPTVCLGVNETTRRGKGRGERKERRQKRRKERDTGEKK